MRTHLRRAALGLLAAAAIATAATPAANANPDIVRIPDAHGHPAFAIGPHANAHDCQVRADTHGAKQYGPRFGTCYQAGGHWWAISPWVA